MRGKRIDGTESGDCARPGRHPARRSVAAIVLAVGAGLAFGGGAVRAASVYEDGDGDVSSRWRVAVRATTRASLRSVYDEARGSKVLVLEGSLADAFRIGGGSSRWKNTAEHVLSWSMSTDEAFAAYAILNTERGARFVRYTNSSTSRLGYKPRFVDHGLGQGASNGRWQTHVRDLQADLNAGESGNRIVSVDGLLFRGSARLDDIELRGSASSPASSPVTSPVVSSGGGASAPPEILASDAELATTKKTVPADSPVSTTSAAPATSSNGRLFAFPGAEGHGRFARGGRGGRVVIVDTLADVVSSSDGRTSLREALQVMSGPRTVVFNVGGTFDMGSKKILMQGEADSYVTLACQSAPAPGVLIRGNGIRIKGGAHDIIMRHCAIRNIDPGLPESDSGRAIGISASSKQARDMIFDHMSLGWATDENFTVFIGPGASADVRNITLSRSIIAEGDADSTHSESGRLPNRYLHSMGPSCNSSSARFPVRGCSIVGNLMANNGRRNPLMWGTSGEVINNVIYNWQETGLDASPRGTGLLELHVTGNVFKAGPTTKRDKPAMRVSLNGEGIRLKISDNKYLDGASGAQRSFKEVSVSQPSQGASNVSGFRVSCVGASRPERSEFDARIVSEFQRGTGQVGIGSTHRHDFRGYSNSRRSSGHDTDRDGMADAWELGQGLNPNDPNDYRGDRNGDGYTNIETYLNAIGNC